MAKRMIDARATRHNTMVNGVTSFTAAPTKKEKPLHIIDKTMIRCHEQALILQLKELRFNLTYIEVILLYQATELLLQLIGIFQSLMEYLLFQ